MPFLPLHIYSGYSFLQSALSLRKIVGLGLKRKYEGIALTDYESMSGFPELYHLCKTYDAKPIFGMDIDVNQQRFTLFIEKEDGYRNLIKLAHACSKGEIDEALFFAHLDGLAVVLNAERSLILEHRQDGIDVIAALLQSYSKRISHLLIGIPYFPDDLPFISVIRQFTSKYPCPTIAFPHILYEKKEDAIALAIVEAISKDEHLEIKELSGDRYYLEQDTIERYYTSQEIDACTTLADSINFEFVSKRGTLLVYPNDEGLSSVDYLRKKAFEGLAKRHPNYDESYRYRLEYELDVIVKMGYADYFLVVADYVEYARSVGISVGPSRGSAAGSLVAYALNIVLLDPLRYGLLFERFLNPKRQSMPDIDIDFADIRREEIVTYLQQKYSKSRVSYIVTMQTLGAKASLRDIGRVYEYPPREIDLIAKSVEFDKLSLGDNYRKSASFKQLIDSDPYYLQIVSLAHKIEGLPRQAGMHAAGVILNNDPLDTSIPVSENIDGSLVCQYEMTYLEEQGFLKMDLLALRNLTIMDRCIELVEDLGGKPLSYADLPYDDEQAISLIKDVNVMGLFQLESPGMKRAIATVQPSSFEDVASVLALFRPGPMEFIPSFAQRKKGREKIDYIVKELEPILSPTYGIIVYQEQIMQIVRIMAGFDFGQADLFRRAISKKDAAKLLSLKQGFVDGCRKNGYPDDIIEKVFALIDKFANYGFAKAHAYGYAVITCQMAYLKRYYTLPFYCVILDEVSTSDSKFSQIFLEMRKQRITFSLPDINASAMTYMPSSGHGVRFPLTAINGLQNHFLYEVIEERNLHGPYLDLFDFALRNKKNGLKLDMLIRLIDAGAFDSIYPHRASLRLSASSAISYAELFVGDGDAVLLDLNFPKPAMKDIQDTPNEDLEAEKEALGVMISGSPLSTKKEVIASRNLKSVDAALESTYNVRVAACVRAFKQITTKKGSKIGFLTIYDQNAELEVTLFQKDMLDAFALLKPGSLIELSVRKDSYKEGAYLGSDIKSL